MADLDSTLHLDMFKRGKRRRGLLGRLKQAVSVLVGEQDLYGLEWGDPDVIPPLQYVRDHFLLPYVASDAVTVEIGPGGGRWTRYMLRSKRIYAVDYHQELLDELKSNLSQKNIEFIRNNGCDFPGIPNASVDFIFSFGTFVHLELDVIDGYLSNMKPLLKQSGNVVIQYADKTKPLAKSNQGFSQNDPEKMRSLISSHGYFIYEEDDKTMWHSALVRFGLRSEDV